MGFTFFIISINVLTFSVTIIRSSVAMDSK